MTTDPPDDPIPNLSGEWMLDAEPVFEPEQGPDGPRSPSPEPPAPITDAGAAPHHSPLTTVHSPDVPPTPEQIIEAMLFVGGPPLTAEAACAAIRGLTPERFHAALDVLSRRYRLQRRPVGIVPRDSGFVLAVLPAFRGLRERVFGGPREARLSQPALDVLSVVAYRQPVGKAEVDAMRGTDSGALLRQLVRLGLVAVQHRAEAKLREVRYGTTPRFLRLFGLASLDELPRLGESTQV
jgi:segregation and condensation protein B